MISLLYSYSQSRSLAPAIAAVVLFGWLAPTAVGQVIAKATNGPVALSTGDAVASSQGGPIQGPKLGFLFDRSTGFLRPVIGIPGASYVGDAMPVNFNAKLIEVSPSHQYALGVEAESGNVYAIDLRGALPEARRLTSVSSGADRVFFSPQGKAAALYYRQPKQVEILTGLPEDDSNRGRISVDGIQGVLTALAVSDDGRTLVAATSHGDGGSLFTAAPGEDLRLVGPVGRVTAISFLNESQDVLLADMGRGEVVRIRGVNADAEWTVLASRRDGVEEPIAVAASRDNSTAFAVDRQNRRVAEMPLAGGAVEFIDCPCSPTGLDVLSSGSVFRLTPASSAPIYVLDARPGNDTLATQPRVLFIPAPERSPSTGEDAAPAIRGRVRH